MPSAATCSGTPPHAHTYLGGAEGGGGDEEREEVGLQRGASPYQLNLNGESKQSDEDEDFLLYNMLDNMSPPTCDISGEGGLQVAHTCEVSTLFEEDASIFPLKGDAEELSCPIHPPDTQEDTAQSAHLMTLGLCRISAAKPAAPAAPPRSSSRPLPPPPPDDPPRLSHGLKQSEMDSDRRRTSPRSRKRLPCLMCPLTLPSRRLLDVHVRSHRVSGGFGCVRCSRTAATWEELEAHWRSHSRRRREELEQRRKVASRFSCPVCLRTFNSAASRNTHQQTKDGCRQRHDGNGSELRRGRLIGRAGAKEAGDSETSRCQTGSLHSVSQQKKQSSRGHTERRTEGQKDNKEKGFCCSLCHRKFSTKLTLRRHLGVHGGDKPHICPHCSYSSRLKASLLQHLRTHTGERPYRCAECPYASIDRSSLLRHMRTHSQERPYSCPHCDYSSIQKKSLDLHARRHHTGEAFPCQQCEYSSPDRQLLLRHVRRHHAPSQHAAM
ncbi:zinc finger protein 605 [Plectropomus leopardus]|uniref:zinc finger protein 605 n=1 Tax=Plectropomus leopardus TaxID=160734 RepID=UPI001C4C6DBD|nr:zinc finger protein 605 [Plectropomus leopardus]